MADVLGRRCILDGELVAGAGLPEDFYALGGRMARRGDRLAGAVPITFVAFDVLWLDSSATTTLSYRECRAILEGLNLTGDGWATVCAFDGYSTDLLGACAELGLEGLIAKRVDAPYRPGKRSDDWVKIKTSTWKVQHARRRHERV
ncbi:MAG: hypothetical protein NVS3B21_27830 [Acidimicrobiales bacterium]